MISRKAVFFAVIAVVSGLPALAAGGSPATSRVPSFVPGDLLVAPAEGVSSKELGSLYEGMGAKLHKVIRGIDVHHISVPPQALAAIEAALKRNPKIKYVERNPLGELAQTPNDPYYSYQWHHTLLGSPAAWDVTTGSSSIPIAILDTGFNASLPDFAGKLLPGYDATTGGSDYTGNTSCSSWGHGTAVATTAAAGGNDSVGSAGIAWQNPILPVLVFDSSCGLQLAAAANGVIWAADHGARVINMSFIFYWAPPPQTFIDAINYALKKGVVVVAAAGNDSKNCAIDTYPCYPQSIPGVIAVSATDQSDLSTSWTNFGSYVALSAPGNYVYSTSASGNLGAWMGTSFSSPIVAGTAALMLSANPALPNQQIAQLLKDSADDKGPAGWDPYYGAGRVNIDRAVQLAAVATPMPTPTPSPSPTPTPTPTPDTLAPTSPSNVQAVAQTTTRTRGKRTTSTTVVNVSWSASQDNVGVSGYTLYRNGAALASLNGSTLSFADKTIVKGTAYSYTVQARDAAGNLSPMSSPANVTP